MKKLMIAAAIVCTAVASQAATFNWSTVEATQRAYGVKAADVINNGPYAAATSGTGNRLYNSEGSWTYVLTLYTAGTENEVGSANGVMVFDEDYGYINTTGIDIANVDKGTTYDYKIVISGVQDNLQARGVVGGYDYSAATIESVIEGSLTTETIGATVISALPSQWTVSGITTSAVPEPTSGLLLLLGVAGLALKRKRA